MNREEFLNQLRRRLAYLPEAEVEKSIDFYAESIDDRMEDGMTEEEAVAALGEMDAIVREIEAALPLSVIVKRRVRDSRERSARRGHSALWVVLAVIGSPVWLPLLIALGAVVLAVCVTIWAVILSLFAVLAALAVTAVGLVIYGLARSAALGFGAVLMVLGGAAMCFGLAVLLEEPLRALAKALARLAVRFWRWVKRLFLKRKDAAHED